MANQSPTPSPEKNAEQPVLVAPQDEQEQYLFYNVMPKNTAPGTMVAPKITVTQPQGLEGASASGSFFKKHKLLIILLASLVILGTIGYFLVVNFAGGGYKTDSILIPPPVHHILNGNNSSSTPGSLTAASSTLISASWLSKYFGSPTCQKPTVCGNDADPDLDGLTNIEEFNAGTDPNNKDSDGDGISDGDEVHIFGSNPLQSHSFGDPQYSDADFIKGGYSIQTNAKLTTDQIAQITSKMNQYGLHEPTVSTLGDIATNLYNFSGPQTAPGGAGAPNAPTTSTSSVSSLNLDESASAKAERDAQRSDTITNIGIALIKYQQDQKTFPVTNSFSDMYNMVKPYNKVATNPLDPINIDPYIYSYTTDGTGKDFSLAFYSETQNLLIKKDSADAQKDTINEEASINDDQRKTDLETIRSALLLYSNKNAAGNQDYVFPTKEKYKTDLVPDFISSIPRDPRTGADYDYEVSSTFDSFTLKTPLDNPPTGTTGFMCNQIDDCKFY